MDAVHSLPHSSFPKTTPASATSCDGLTQEEEDRFLREWDGDIQRAARSSACLVGLTADEADDLAQETRLHVLQVCRRHKVVEKRYLRVAIKNHLITARSRIRNWRGLHQLRIQRDRQPNHSREGYLHSEDESSIGTQGMSDQPVEELGGDSDPMVCTRGSREAISYPYEPDVFAIRKVGKWVHQLPGNLRRIYEALYVKGNTLREAAALMGLSHPRVAQLHQQLLARGQRELNHLAA